MCVYVYTHTHTHTHTHPHAHVYIYIYIYVYIYIFIYKERERKIPLTRLARDQTGAQLLNIPGLSDGTYTQLNFLRVIICYCPYPWAVQRNRGALHFVISFIC